jgi:predicted ATPase
MTTPTDDRRHLRGFCARDDEWPRHVWPFTIPAVAQVLTDGLDIPAGVTFLVGENGSGKSTLVEAMAAAYPRAGASASKHKNLGPEGAREDSPLRYHLKARTAPLASPQGFFLRAELMHDYLEEVGREPGAERMWQGVDLQARSHGESFLEVLRQRFTDVGVYFLDEPESALSFQSSLALVALLAVLASEGSQVVCATHSPLLCSLPGATVLEVGEHGIRPAQWEELDLVRHWRGFLEAPGRYLRHLTD